MGHIWDTIEGKAKSVAAHKKPRIAIALRRDTLEVHQNLELASQYAEVVIVGDALPGYESLAAVSDEKAAAILLNLLNSGEVGGIVRGQIKQATMYGEIKRVFGCQEIRPLGLLRMHHAITDDGKYDGHEFFFGPGTLYERDTNESKLSFIEQAASFMREWGIEPSIGVVGRIFAVLEDEGKYFPADESQKLVDTLQGKGYSAHYHGRLVEEAIRHHNLVVPSDGFCGQMIYRTLIYCGNGEGLAYPYLLPGLSANIIGSSQFDDRCGPLIILAAARAG